MNQSSHFTETESVNGVLTGLERQVGDADERGFKYMRFHATRRRNELLRK